MWWVEARGSAEPPIAQNDPARVSAVLGLGTPQHSCTKWGSAGVSRASQDLLTVFVQGLALLAP